MEAFTPQNIPASFTVTGIELFNPNVIPMSKMQPSMEFSTQGTFPMTLPTPVKHVATIMRDAAAVDLSRDSNTPTVTLETPRSHHL